MSPIMLIVLVLLVLLLFGGFYGYRGGYYGGPYYGGGLGIIGIVFVISSSSSCWGVCEQSPTLSVRHRLDRSARPVSYTHLTLPTICSV